LPLNLFSFSVPSAVKNIHISPNGATDSLTVSWTPGGGDVDSYVVSAFRQNQKVESQTIPKHISEHTLHRLEAGEQYQITIASVSGSLRNQINAVGRTGKHPPGEGSNYRVFYNSP
jgi:cadherin 5 type 2 (VE-cadherin)